MLGTGLEFISSQTPLNLCYLAAVARDAGAEVRIWDYDVEKSAERGLRARLKKFSPEIVGVTIMTPTAPRAARIAQIAKEALPDVLTVAGGPHASALPEQVLKECPSFDLTVFGEGEETFREITRQVESRNFSGLRGAAYRTGDRIVRNAARPSIEKLDSLPLPARDLLPLGLYHGQSYRGFSRDFLNIAEVATSRGCPNKCIFCAIQVTHGTGVRFRSAENVAVELHHLVENYGTNHVVFLDDTFTLKPDRLREIMKALKALSLTWNCTTRVDSVDVGLLREMVAHGCRGVAFGVESGSPRVLELIGKRITVEQVKKAFRAAHEAGVPNIEADFILGVHPSETERDIAAAERLISEIQPTTLFLSVAVPYPGTPLWSMMQEEGLVRPDPDWEDFVMYGAGDSWRTEHFTTRQLRRRQRSMLRRFYMSPGRIARTLARVRSASEMFYYLKSGLALFRGTGR
jgi:radical SAM superfamily enzyme YgiQ (UPF0313 family)